MKKVITASGVLVALMLASSLWLFQGDPPDWRTTPSYNVEKVKAQSRASGPLRREGIDSLYFTDGTGKAIYLTGSHVWNNFQDVEPPFRTNTEGHMIEPGTKSVEKFDFADYLRFLEKENHNFIRLWTWEQSAWVPWLASKPTISPLPYLRSGPGIALDGKLKFDLTQFDQEYFDRLRSRVIAAGERGIYVSVMLFQGWSVDSKGMSGGKSPWLGHPFNRANNVNGVDGDPNGDGEATEAHTLQVAQVTALQEAYVRKTVATLNDLDNVLWEISNESDAVSNDWQYHMIEFLKQCEAEQSKQHPVGMTFCVLNGQNADLFRSPADWISPNSTREENYRENPPAGDGRKVIISDTDHLWGMGGSRAWVWKSFARGLNPIYMDSPAMPQCESIRRAMGMTLAYANRMNLSAMKPRGELASSGYCLANPGEEYLAYAPLEVPWLESRRFFGRLQRPIRKIRRLFPTKVALDLSSQPAEFSVEWFNPSTGETQMEHSIKGGKKQSLTAPFRGDAVLYVRKKA